MRQLIDYGMFILLWPLQWLHVKGSHRARIIIQQGDEVLLVMPRFGGGKWQLPGGGIKRSESAAAAGVREIEEELGVQANEQQLEYIGDTVVSENRIPYRATLLRYRCRERPPVDLGRIENQSYAWMNILEARRQGALSHASQQLLQLVEK